jgi:hypothetical protein
MALTRGSFRGYEFDRMVILFSMFDGQEEIPCAISTSALDDLESLARSKPNEREAQFMRLRDRIEEVPLANFLQRSSRALLQALSCAVSISKNSCKLLL